MTEVNSIAVNIDKIFECLKEIHNKVKQYKCPNYKGARIPVSSDLVIQPWQSNIM